MTSTILDWLHNDDQPADVYHLLGALRFDPDHDRLLADIRAAYAALLPYQNHADPEVARRAMQLQMELGRAEDVFSTPDRYHAHHKRIMACLREEHAAATEATGAAWSPDQVRMWLEKACSVHPQSSAGLAGLIAPAETETPEPAPGHQLSMAEILDEELPPPEPAPRHQLSMAEILDEELGTTLPPKAPVGRAVARSCCPSCFAPLEADAVICVSCGRNLLTGGMLTTMSESASRRSTDVWQARTKRLLAAPRIRISRALLGDVRRLAERVLLTPLVLLLIALFTWGAFSLIWWVVTWYQHEVAYYEISLMLDRNRASAARLAQESDHLVWYSSMVDSRSPRPAAGRKAKIAELIPDFPHDVNLEPLLEFPPGSFAYEPTLELARQCTDREWRLAKSCDRSGNVRAFGADLLIAMLPFVDFDAAAKGELIERTSIEEKKHRYWRYREECQQKAEQVLCGRYRLTIEATHVYGHDPRSSSDTNRWLSSQDSTTTPEPILDVSCHEEVWLIELAGQRWTGEIEQIVDIDLSCPATEMRDALAEFEFLARLEKSSVHLRFSDRQFVVEVEPIPRCNLPRRKRELELFKPGFSALECALQKEGL